MHSRYFGVQKEVPLAVPDVLVCSVGTEIFFEAAGSQPVPDQKWIKLLDEGWNRDAILESASQLSGLTLQVCLLARAAN